MEKLTKKEIVTICDNVIRKLNAAKKQGEQLFIEVALKSEIQKIKKVFSMKAEEYIENLSTTFENPDIDSTSEIVETFIAKKAIEIARKEEREKAIEALDIAIMTIFEKNNHSVSIEKLIDQFDKLLNE